MENIGNNIINHIYLFLNVENISKAEMSSKKFKSSNLLWKNLLIRDFNLEITNNFIENCKKYYEQLYTGTHTTDGMFIHPMTFCTMARKCVLLYENGNECIYGRRSFGESIISVSPKINLDTNVVFFFSPNYKSVNKQDINTLNKIINDNIIEITHVISYYFRIKRIYYCTPSIIYKVKCKKNYSG